MYKIIFAVLLSIASLTVFAQRTSVDEYIEQFKEIAMNEMKRSGVPASITLAQGILESESGNSELVKKSNNHFGIKCKSTWGGTSVTHDDDETGECFRAYTNADESYRDHSDFLRANKRYHFLFTLNPTDYAGWAKGLKKAGYATNPRYPEMLIRNIEQYNLNQYTLLALNGPKEMDVAATDRSLGNIPAEFKEALSTPVGTVNGETSYDVVSVNNTKCIYAKKGTSLLAIANKKDISLKKLMEFNDMTEEGLLQKDQYIYLHKKPKTGEKEFYIVNNGETVYDVAQKNGIQLKYLLEYNSIDSDTRISQNTKLFLQPGLSNVTYQAENKRTRIHLVAPKEGLYAIAKAYNVSVEQLKAWNNLESDNLKIGQELIVGK